MNTKTKNIFFIALLSIILIFGFIFNRTFQTILFVAVPVLVGFIFDKFNNENKKLYFSVMIIILLVLTAYYSIENQIYILDSTIPLLGGLTCTLFYVDDWKKRKSLIDSTNLIKEGKFEEALPHINYILESDPQNFYALYNKAVIFNETGKYAESIELSDKVLKKDPKNDFALNLKANALIKLEKYDDASEIIDKLLKKNSKNEITLFNKALALSGQGNYQDAIGYYENSLKRLSPLGKWKFKGMLLKTALLPSKLAEFWFEKGKAHQELQQYNEALDSFNKAINIYSDSEDALNARSEVLKIMGK